MNKQELKKFGLRGGIVLAILGSLFLWRGVHAYPFFFCVSAYNLLGALLFPVILIPLHKAVFFVVKLLGIIVTSVVMFFAFYCIFTPIGILGRLFNNHFLDEPLDSSRKSYWEKREPESMTKEVLENQF